MQKLAVNKGFTLIELAIAMTIGSVVTIGITTSYSIQQETFLTHQHVSAMQQQVRSALFILKREIRLAGYEATSSPAGAGFKSALTGKIEFTMDDKEVDGIIGKFERSTFALLSTADPATIDVDGIADNGSSVLVRIQKDESDNDVINKIAGDIRALTFAYAYDEDEDGNLDSLGVGGQTVWAYDSDGNGYLDTHLDTNNDGWIDSNDTEGGEKLTDIGLNEVSINKIRAVKIWILARTEAMTKWSVTNREYVVGYDRIKPQDNYKYMLMETIVDCRNMT